MSRAKHKRTPGKFIMLRMDITSSAAWRSLPANARCVWLLLAERYNGHNNGAISLSVREAAANILTSKTTATRAIDALLHRGFVKITADSSFNMKSGRRARRFALTHEPLNNRSATSDWRKWADPNSERGITRGT